MALTSCRQEESVKFTNKKCPQQCSTPLCTSLHPPACAQTLIAPPPLLPLCLPASLPLAAATLNFAPALTYAYSCRAGALYIRSP